MAESVSELIQRRLALRKELPGNDERRAIRIRAGLTQQEVADAVGATRAAVAQWETGVRYPRGLLLDRYVEALRALREAGAKPPTI